MVDIVFETPRLAQEASLSSREDAGFRFCWDAPRARVVFVPGRPQPLFLRPSKEAGIRARPQLPGSYHDDEFGRRVQYWERTWSAERYQEAMGTELNDALVRQLFDDLFVDLSEIE